MKQRIVIKIGTDDLTTEDGNLNRESLWNLVNSTAKLQQDGYSCILVSSGAVGCGVDAFNLKSYPKDVATKQACAAVGQVRLMQLYQDLFNNFELNVAQILLSGRNLQSAEQSQLVANTLNRLAEQNTVIPIINENDVVTTDELTFSDNDHLAVSVGKLLHADKVFLLTSTDGLHPPNGKEILETVEDVNEVLDYANGTSGKFSTGGMAAKLQSVKTAVDAGIETYIINGEFPERVLSFLNGETTVGTKFLAKSAN